MTSKDDILRMAREAGAYRLVEANKGSMICISQAQLERFAALVIANHPPQSFMSWQEGYEAGKQGEREACAKLCAELHPGLSSQRVAEAIRAREQA